MADIALEREMEYFVERRRHSRGTRSNSEPASPKLWRRRGSGFRDAGSEAV
jgi:hypothetical protein